MTEFKRFLASAEFVGRWYMMLIVCMFTTVILSAQLTSKDRNTQIASNAMCKMTDIKPDGEVLQVKVDCQTARGVVEAQANTAFDRYLFIVNPRSNLSCNINAAQRATDCTLP